MIRQNSANRANQIAELDSAAQDSCCEALITAIELACIAGDQPFALFGAVGSDLSGSSQNPLLKVAVKGQNGDQAVMTAPVAELDGIELPAERMDVLAGLALDRAANALPSAIDKEKVLVVTLLPSRDTARGTVTDTAQFKQRLQNQTPQLSTAVFRFVEATSGPTQQLIEVCRELAAGTWQAVLFGGVDSLVDMVSCTELALTGRLMTTASTEGLVPGEAAAYLLLQPTDAKPAAILAHIRGAFQAEEPHSGKADSQKMTGLATAMEQALSQGNISAKALGGVVIPFGAETAGSLEWYQTALKLWPPGETEPAMKQPEELQLHIALGETGAATLPLSLVLACARFDFDYPPLQHLLVSAAGDGPFRGAVLLKKQEKG